MKRLLLSGLLVAAAAYAALPLVLPLRMDWLAGPIRLTGLALVLLVLAVYAWLAMGRRALRVDARGFRLRSLDVALLLAFPLYLLFIGNGLWLTSADNISTMALGPVVLRKGTIDLSSVPIYQKRRLPYSGIRVGDRILPAFPLGTGLLSVPYVAVTELTLPGGDDDARARRRDKHLAALLTVATTVLFFLGVRSRHGETSALAVTLVFALATTVFSNTSQALWSITGALFLLSVALWLLLAPDASTGRALLAGLAVGGAFACRPTVLLAGGALAIFLWRRWPELLVYAFGVLISVGVTVLALHAVYGHPLGGYGLINPGNRWGDHLQEGLVGTLLSPSRGVLLFFPYLFLLPWGLPSLRDDPRLRQTVLAASVASIAIYLVVSGYDVWWGGKSVGPRLMTEVAPFLALLMLPVFRRWRELGRTRMALAVTLALAVGTQVLSTYTYRAYVWNRHFDIGQKPVRWSYGQSQLLALWCPSCVLPSSKD
ncbi:MAG: hypothetical protein LJF30_10385 [Acidobacteria bacterium]|nr:hypothetical protein [Acidobacteriota bacterium]